MEAVARADLSIGIRTVECSEHPGATSSAAKTKSGRIQPRDPSNGPFELKPC